MLSPNGVFAIIGYHYPLYAPREEDAAKSDAINKVVDGVGLLFQGKLQLKWI